MSMVRAFFGVAALGAGLLGSCGAAHYLGGGFYMDGTAGLPGAGWVLAAPTVLGILACFMILTGRDMHVRSGKGAGSRDGERDGAESSPKPPKDSREDDPY